MTQVPVTQAYGIAVDGGQVWFGAGGNLARVALQSIGGPSDRAVPVANSAPGQPDDRIRIDITVSNAGSAAIAGDALYMYSPGAFAAKATFALAPGATQVLQDAFGNLGSTLNLAVGSVRLRVTTGNAADLQASVRTTRVTPTGAAYGYAIGAQTIPESVGPGSQALLFTGARPTEVSILGMYTMVGATGVLTLAAPDGTVRGTRPFTLAINTREEFNPAASAFGVDPEPGDLVRVSVETGDAPAVRQRPRPRHVRRRGVRARPAAHRRHRAQRGRADRSQCHELRQRSLPFESGRRREQHRDGHLLSALRIRTAPPAIRDPRSPRRHGRSRTS